VRGDRTGRLEPKKVTPDLDAGLSRYSHARLVVEKREMSLFGPKLPCARCGKEVRKPRDPADFLCNHCHQPGPWADQSQVDGWEKAESERKHADEERQMARQRYSLAVARLAAGDGSSVAGMSDLAVASGYSPQEFEGIGVHAFQQYANLALADDVITQEEDNHLQAMVPALGLSWQAINNASPGLLDHIVIAEANGDLLPVLDDSRVILKKGEVAHWQCTAALMKDVTQREFRAGYQGFSFPIGKSGIRYRVGGARGHSVVTGHQLQVVDQGTLVVTSARTVYMGAAKTQEFSYAKLVGLDVFTDGVRLHVSNRQTASLFRVPNGEVLAALIHAAMRPLATTS
jgi:hypothetical protein